MDYPAREDMGGDGKFTDGVSGVSPASFDKADDMNQLYDEQIAIIEGGGLTPNFANRGQMLAGIDARWGMRLSGLQTNGFTEITAFNLNTFFRNADRVINSNAGSPLPPGERGRFKCCMGSDNQQAYQQVVGLSGTSKGRMYRRYLTAGVWDVDWDEVLSVNFLAEQFPRSLAASGYQQLPGGMIMQWGVDPTNVVHGGTYDIVFPIAFPTAVINIQLTEYGVDTGGEDAVISINDNTITAVGFSASVDGTLTSYQVSGCSWLVIGH